MSEHLIKYLTEDDDGTALTALLREMERQRAMAAAQSLQSVIESHKQTYRDKMKAEAGHIKNSLSAIINQLDDSLSGQLSQMVKSSSEEKLKRYDDLGS